MKKNRIFYCINCFTDFENPEDCECGICGGLLMNVEEEGDDERQAMQWGEDMAKHWDDGLIDMT